MKRVSAKISKFRVARAITSTDIRTMPLSSRVEPQLPKLAERASTGPRWMHEIKFDGLLELDGEDVARLPLPERKERLRFGIT